MSYTVTGHLRDGRPYRLHHTGDRITSDTTLAVLAWLELLAETGEPVLATPTGPAYTVRLHDPRAVLAALVDTTNVVHVTGDPPVIAPQLPPGAIS